MLKRIKATIGDRALRRLLPEGFYFSRPGYCPCCMQRVQFRSCDPWLRDFFRCSACGSIPRQRALMSVLESRCPHWRDLAIHEAAPTPGGASDRLQQDCKNYVGSTYRPQQPFGSMVGPWHNQDLEAQTFPSESFDLVITQDVVEHVYDPASLFREVARTLKPGGRHVFSVPLVNKHRPSQIWAVKGDDGQPRFLHEPDYHGAPGGEGDSFPVASHWGYDIVRHIHAACGLPTEIECVDDLEQGIRGEFMEILVTTKPLAD